MSYGMDTNDYIDRLKARLAAAEAERDALRDLLFRLKEDYAQAWDEATDGQFGSVNTPAYVAAVAALARRPAAE
jgi:predicted RNA-binding Zn ribbon-like protein